MIRVKRYMRRYKKASRMMLTGPNCAGTISPGKAMLGIMPGHIYLPGRVGIVGRSGTLGYEAAEQMKELGIGVSTSVGIGGDPINGSSFKDVLELFEQDPETDAVMLIGEIGGPQEAEAAAFSRDHMKKPVIAYIAGLSAPKGRCMGHAGAIVSAFGESAAEKVEILKAAGVTIAPNPSEMGAAVAKTLSACARSPEDFIAGALRAPAPGAAPDCRRSSTPALSTTDRPCVRVGARGRPVAPRVEDTMLKHARAWQPKRSTSTSSATSCARSGPRSPTARR